MRSKIYLQTFLPSSFIDYKIRKTNITKKTLRTFEIKLFKMNQISADLNKEI